MSNSISNKYIKKHGNIYIDYHNGTPENEPTIAKSQKIECSIQSIDFMSLVIVYTFFDEDMGVYICQNEIDNNTDNIPVFLTNDEKIAFYQSLFDSNPEKFPPCIPDENICFYCDSCTALKNEAREYHNLLFKEIGINRSSTEEEFNLLETCMREKYGKMYEKILEGPQILRCNTHASHPEYLKKSIKLFQEKKLRCYTDFSKSYIVDIFRANNGTVLSIQRKYDTETDRIIFDMNYHY